MAWAVGYGDQPQAKAAMARQRRAGLRAGVDPHVRRDLAVVLQSGRRHLSPRRVHFSLVRECLANGSVQPKLSRVAPSCAARYHGRCRSGNRRGLRPGTFELPRQDGRPGLAVRAPGGAGRHSRHRALCLLRSGGQPDRLQGGRHPSRIGRHAHLVDFFPGRSASSQQACNPSIGRPRRRPPIWGPNP